MKTREDKYQKIWEDYRNSLKPTEKAELTKFKNAIADTNSKYLAMCLTVLMHGYDPKRFFDVLLNEIEE